MKKIKIFALCLLLLALPRVASAQDKEQQSAGSADGLASIAAALTDSSKAVVIAVVRDNLLNATQLENLATAAGDIDAEGNPAEYFLGNQNMLSISVDEVLYGSMPERPAFLLGSRSGVIFPNETQRMAIARKETFLTSDLPSFRKHGGRWLAFLVPVRDGSELEDSATVRTKFAILKSAGFFNDRNVYKLYGLKLAFPLSGNTEEQIGAYATPLPDDFVTDLRGVIQNHISALRGTIQPATITAIRSAVTSAYGRELVKKLDPTMK